MAALRRTQPTEDSAGVCRASAARFSQIGRSPTTPMAWRSSGTRATPWATRARGVSGSGRSSSCTVPAAAGSTPDSTSASRPWPLPDTPAMPSISPAAICSDTPIRATRSPCAWPVARPCTTRRGAKSAGRLRRSRCRPTTDWPTLQRASSAGLVSAVRASATVLPARSTCTRCDMAITSPSLWLMKMMAMPCATNWRKVANRLSASCGVSTAVGSSSTSTRAPRYSALRISTRWRSPTDRSATRASGSTTSPACCATATSRARAAARRVMGAASDSVPSTMLSSTLRLSARVKCWCTMPTPAANAARVSPGGSGVPFTSIVPASAR